MKGLRERLLGSPEGLDGPALARVLRRGDEALRIRAARALAGHLEEPATALLVELLEDPSPGVRRAALRGLGGRGVARGIEGLQGRERVHTVLLAAAVARVRCGQPRGEALAALEASVLRPVETVRGIRTPEQAIGLGIDDLGAELDQALGEEPPDLEEAQGLEDLGAQARLEDYERLLAARHGAGKRAENAWLVAVGRHGDPRFAPSLREALGRMDLDPGRAFAHRRLAALSLGRIGDRDAAKPLVEALEVEALEHEGRPGAGLGVQYPVRTVLLWALGELQSRPEVLAGYLGNLHGSALGGFHLPAMGALWKLGEAARPILTRVAAGRDEAAANARGVLAAL